MTRKALISLLNPLLPLAAVAALFMGTGCVRHDEVGEEEHPIAFEAGSMLLLDDLTKGATPKDAGDDVGNFLVFGVKTVSGNTYPVFEGGESGFVSHIEDVWRYSPVRFWDSNASSYKFLGISGPEVDAEISYTTTPLAATVPYSINSQCDLMASCYHRDSNAQGELNTTDEVDMAFDHLLSAVSVVIYNDSPLQDVSLVHYGFRNLIISSNVTVTYSSTSPSILWVEATKVKDTSNPLLLWTPNGTDGVKLTHKGDTDEDVNTHAHTPLVDALNWDMMIPQNLNPLSLAPMLLVKYRLVDYSDDPEPEPILSEPIETPIRLNTIKTAGGEDIFDWVRGKKYIYEVHIRYGGGISVTVTTTTWDAVSAGTPGLIVS